MKAKDKSDILQGERWVEWDVDGNLPVYFQQCFSLNRTNFNISKHGPNYPYLKEGETPSFKGVPGDSFDFVGLLFSEYMDFETYADRINESLSINIVDTMSEQEIINELPENHYLSIK